jgi:hypothetical protein
MAIIPVAAMALPTTPNTAALAGLGLCATYIFFTSVTIVLFLSSGAVISVNQGGNSVAFPAALFFPPVPGRAELKTIGFLQAVSKNPRNHHQQSCHFFMQRYGKKSRCNHAED